MMSREFLIDGSVPVFVKTNSPSDKIVCSPATTALLLTSSVSTLHWQRRGLSHSLNSIIADFAFWKIFCPFSSGFFPSLSSFGSKVGHGFL